MFMVLLAGMPMQGPFLSAALGQERNRVRVDRATTQQKAVYIDMLLTRSVAVKTIEASDDDAAKANLQKARDLAVEAKSDLESSLFQEANDKLNRALSLVNSEAQRLSKHTVQRDQLAASYEKRLHTVQTFLKAYQRVAKETNANPVVAEQTANLESLISTAKQEAAAGRYREANGILDAAYEEARGDIRKMRSGKTLVRSLNFDTPEKEYDYEVGRNKSHQMLLKFAIAEKKPPQMFLKRIEELRQRAMTYRGTAEKSAADKDYPAAIDEMVRSTTTLLKAIRMTGLYIPG
jgi:tetratricopeptide (TPR) repeat protein